MTSWYVLEDKSIADRAIIEAEAGPIRGIEEVINSCLKKDEILEVIFFSKLKRKQNLSSRQWPPVKSNVKIPIFVFQDRILKLCAKRMNNYGLPQDFPRKIFHITI